MSVAARRQLSLAVLFTLTAGPALAGGLTSQEVLNQFNLVVLGDAKSASDVHGRAYVGGNLTAGEYEQWGWATPASGYAGLTVGGNASGVTVDNGGAVIGGTLSNSTINNGATVVHGTAGGSHFNGSGTTYVGIDGGGNSFNSGRALSITGALKTQDDAATSTDFAAVLKGLSSQLSALADTKGTIEYNGYGRATFNAVAGLGGVAVFDLSAGDAAQLFSQGEFAFNMGSATTLIINVDALDVDISANFLDSAATKYGSKILWNFYDATDVTINRQFGGTVLAAGASFANYQDIEGDVLVKTLDQHGELHLDPFNGNIPTPPVPEPETYAMLMAGLGILGSVVRRRRG